MQPNPRLAPRAQSRSRLVALAVLIVGTLAGPASADPHTLAAFPTNEAYLRYLGNAPAGFEGDWVTDFNGITHDDTHWYLAGRKSLHRVPLSQRIDRDLRTTDTPWIDADAFPELEGAQHFGDISYHEHAGRGYVLVPADKRPDGGLPILAIFRADDSLALVAALEIPTQLRNGEGQAGFVAVSGAGHLYSAVNRGPCASGVGSCLHRYTLDWDALEAGEAALAFDPAWGEVPFRDAQGGALELSNFQGAVIAPSSRVLYVSNGYNCDSANPGLHAFELRTDGAGRQSAHQLARSGQQPDHLFRFQWECDWWTVEIDGKPGNEEPQGLTIWDLDARSNPHGIRGQLHVLMLDNDLDGTDHGTFKHYSGRIHVDPARSSGDGRIGSAYDSLDEALTQRSCTWIYNLPPWPAPPYCVQRPVPWSGSTLVLAPGSYSADLLADPRLEGIAISSSGAGALAVAP